MDVNCGGIADGSMTIEERGEHIYQMMLRIASGERSKSEQHGYGQNEFVPWQIGAIT
jgi:altronate hydrolase